MALGINKIKKLNFLTKNESKIILVLTKTKRKIYICCLKKTTNNQARQIICLSVVSRYYFHFLKKLFIKSFSCKDKNDCRINNLDYCLN